VTRHIRTQAYPSKFIAVYALITVKVIWRLYLMMQNELIFSSWLRHNWVKWVGQTISWERVNQKLCQKFLLFIYTLSGTIIDNEYLDWKSITNTSLKMRTVSVSFDGIEVKLYQLVWIRAREGSRVILTFIYWLESLLIHHGHSISWLTKVWTMNFYTTINWRLVLVIFPMYVDILFRKNENY